MSRVIPELLDVYTIRASFNNLANECPKWLICDRIFHKLGR